MAYELILPFQPHIPDLEKHLLTPLRTRRLIPHGESLVPYEPCSLRANTDTLNVPTHRPMSLAELQMLFTRMYDSTALGQHPVLPIQVYTLAEYVKNDVQRRLLAPHGRAVAFTPSRVNAQQIYSKRDSYINALLIQSRGVVSAQPCTSCQQRQGQNTFPKCHQVPGFFEGCCTNCKWPDKALQCSLQGQAGGHVQPAISGQPRGIQGHQGQARRLINLDLEEGKGAENPINLDLDKGEEGNPIVL
jgi:hypothetical protein